MSAAQVTPILHPRLALVVVAVNRGWINGGGAVASESGQDGTTITLPGAPSYPGHTFNGWFSAPNGGVQVTSPFTLTGNSLDATNPIWHFLQIRLVSTSATVVQPNVNVTVKLTYVPPS